MRIGFQNMRKRERSDDTSSLGARSLSASKANYSKVEMINRLKMFTKFTTTNHRRQPLSIILSPNTITSAKLLTSK